MSSVESAPRSPTLKRNFIRQQGLGESPAASCPLQYSALMFQPRVVGLVVLVAAILREPRLFLALALVLWWSALLPRLNPLDAFYNRLLAPRSGGFALPPAPGPRRFAQGMAGTFALAIAVSLVLRWNVTATVLEGILLAAVGALVFGGFCFGSFVFHLLCGRAVFARRTLPWARGD